MSKTATISLIACIGKNRELGNNNDLIWKIPEDLAYFKKVTGGHVVVMGEKTYKSIGRPLPNRTNIVLSDNPDFQDPNIVIARSMEEALEKANEKEKEEIFFIGGGYVYSQSIKFADKLYLTLVEDESKADVFFPDYSDFTAIEKVGQGMYKELKYQYLILTKDAKKR